MKKSAAILVLAGSVFAASTTQMRAQNSDRTAPSPTAWPTHGWAKGAPASVGLDEKVLKGLDTDLTRGKYALVDSFAVFRCGVEVFDRKYSHDYGTLYGKEAKTRGPLNARLTVQAASDGAWTISIDNDDLNSSRSTKDDPILPVLELASEMLTKLSGHKHIPDTCAKHVTSM